MTQRSNLPACLRIRQHKDLTPLETIDFAVTSAWEMFVLEHPRCGVMWRIDAQDFWVFWQILAIGIDEPHQDKEQEQENNRLLTRTLLDGLTQDTFDIELDATQTAQMAKWLRRGLSKIYTGQAQILNLSLDDIEKLRRAETTPQDEHTTPPKNPPRKPQAPLEET